MRRARTRIVDGDQGFVFGPKRLAQSRRLRLALPRMFAAGQAAFEFPCDRAPLDLDSYALWIEHGNDAPVAACVFFDAGFGRLWLDFLYVEPEHRRRGLGRRLIRQLRVVGAVDRFNKIMLGTNVDNAAMRGLAAAEGYAAETVGLTLQLGARR